MSVSRRLAAALLVLSLVVLPLAPAAAQAATPGPAPVLDLAVATAETFDATMHAELDAYAAGLAARSGVVGASVAVVQGRKTVFSRGYGVRELGGMAPVTPDTRFMIGSVTKNMAAFMAATVVDDGLAAWDTPLADLLPGFALADPELTERVTLADAFCACTGLPRDDFPIILNPQPDPAALLATMSGIAPVSPFGEAYHYSNQMVAAGGFAATMADGGAMDTLGRDFAVAMETRVLGPIGMDASTFSLETVLASGNHASPHGPNLDGALSPFPVLFEDRFAAPIAPAGALWSTAPDMARYLATQLAGGIAPGGARVVSEQNLARTWQPRVPLDAATVASQPAALADAFDAYALGWNAGTWNGIPILHHSGGTLGFVSEVAMLPDADAGIVILANGGSGAGTFALGVQSRLFELLYGLEPTAGSELDGEIALAAARLAEAVASVRPADPAAVAPFAGRWRNPELGDLRLAVRDGAAEAAIGAYRSPLAVSAADAAPGEYRVHVTRAPFAVLPMRISLREGADGAREVAIVGVTPTGEREYPFSRVE